ncbi:MAG: 1-deoxy-D-xylulose-5-phosphate reductoisomerase, partial [bacterium]|nr:1-deoxy-D-xylulose-5-phosphate reductoisomerase [bacterium]
VLSAIVGAAGLKPTSAAIEKGRTIALANKESLVIAGEIMTSLASRKKVSLLPVDSEHSAIFQVLAGNRRSDLKRIILTASGGPFREKTKEELKEVTVEKALKHPNWDMGPKITIDSATLMNKGLEVIEASWLFSVPADQINVQVHPQSIIHSMVEYIDGSVLAQMGVPDMRCAIGYALAYPERIETGVASLDLVSLEKLTFYKPDPERFRCLALAYETAKNGGSYPAVLNAANEIAVAGFLDHKISFLDIAVVIEKTLNAHKKISLKTLEELFEVDRWAREQAAHFVKGKA